MVERTLIVELLDELRFEDLDRLLDEQQANLDPDLVEEVRQRRRVAEQRAHALCQQIIDLGSDSREAEVAALARDPSTRPLLRLLDDASRERADVYLREGERWEERRRETNARRLSEARRALAGLDLELARGLMNKIDGRFLSQDLAQERDDLILAISARTMELESLEDVEQELIDRTGKHRNQGRPWWRRWFQSG